MGISDIILMAWKNLTSNKMRTLLTITGISIGIAAIVFLVSLGYGLQELSIRRISSISALTSLDVTPAQGAVSINNKTLTEFAAIPNVEKTSPLLSLGGQMSFGDAKTDIAAYAVNADYFAMQSIKTKTGRIFDDNGEEAVISSALIKALNSQEDKLYGQDAIFTSYFPKGANSSEFLKKEYKLHIAGIIDDDSSSFIYFPLNTVKDLINDTTVYGSTKVKISSQEKLSEVKSAIEAKGFKSSAVAETISQVYGYFKIIQIVLGSFGIVALFVACIGMFNTMTIALLERTRDIGIMKSIGVQNKAVLRMFLAESFLISLLGGTLGIGLGVVTSNFVNLIVNLLAKSVGGSPEKIFTTPLEFVLIILGFSMIVGIATGFYPANRASKLNPLETLRYE